ncbi:MAG: ABC transporter permease [Gammaproteobacteria bacterium]|nr:ABC transporter permease [Gammaproteobacteria bacterium]
MKRFSIQRLCAIIIKEFIQMKRDRLTFAMIVAIPLLQLILFGYAINSNPKYLPTAVMSSDQSAFTRRFIRSLQDTTYFRVVSLPKSEAMAQKLLRTNRAQFVLNIPSDFSRDLIRGKRPSLLLTVDTTDSMAAANAIAASNILTKDVFDHLLTGALSYLRPTPPPFNLIIHAKYNPELITQYNIVPGLIGVVLTMTMVIITALAMTREVERGTMESLLATPARPLEVMLGKVIPYIIVGYLQLFLILGAAYFVFRIPAEGSLFLLCCAALPFIAANLSVGVMFSTAAKNQLQATQMSIFFFLPSILLSGFMFPFYGMPVWAQKIGSILPLTYFLRMTRGILLKGNTLADAWPNIWPIILFMIIALFVGVMRYRQTLD